ncbi:hypothetical protein NCC49_000229 [Naganishia albida]|nr:hypothetical protein NCC49_000229 [Naganishia albida]
MAATIASRSSRPATAPSYSSMGLSGMSDKRISTMNPASGNRMKVAEKRKNYYAVVRRGAEEDLGRIFESWQEAEVEIKSHPDTSWKVFKTRLAAEAYVAENLPAPSRDKLDIYDMQLDINDGAIGSSSSSLGMPFHEHLAKNFPSSPPLSSSSLPLAPPRPYFAQSSSRRSSNASLRLASPLRQEVIEEEPDNVSAEETVMQESSPSAPRELLALPSASSNPKRKSFFGTIRSVARNPSKSENRENDQPPAVLKSPEAVARPATLTKRHRSESQGLSMTNSRPEGSTPFARPGTAPSTIPQTPGRRPPSVRSNSSLSVNAPPPTVRARPATSQSAKSLWADSAPVVDLSDALTTPPQSPGKVYDEYPEVVDAPLSGTTPNAPKFSRSALKKTGVTLPMPSPKLPSSPRVASPLGSPWQSPSGSRMSLRRTGSILSLDASISICSPRPSVTTPSPNTGNEEPSGYFDTFDQSRANGNAAVWHKASLPNLPNAISTASLASAFSASSYKTAYDATTPTTGSTQVSSPETSSSQEGSQVLSPTLSNNSTSDGTRTYSESGASSSEHSHSLYMQRSGNCLGEAKAHAKKSGGLKRFLRIFGMTSKAGPLSATT